jgi:acetyltransferase-like isoleucine patch superfamily enzyme
MIPARKRFAFRSCGHNVTIYEWVRILDAHRITIGSHVVIDDFVFVDGGAGISIGSHVHIAGYSSLIGGGEIDIGDFCGISAGSRLVSGTDLADGSGLTGPTIPPRWRAVERTFIKLGRHAMLGTNVVVHPGVTIGEGVVVGSGSLVNHDLPPWTICFGTPARPVRERPRELMLAYERELLAQEGSGK